MWLCVLVCCVGVGVGVCRCGCGVCLCVAARRKNAEKRVCGFKNTSVCACKTSPFVSSKRTHGKRFESTHGSHRQFCLPRKAHVRYHVLQRLTENNHWTGCCPCSSLRKDREQHVPDSSNHSLYLTKIVKQQSLWRNVGGNQP